MPFFLPKPSGPESSVPCWQVLLLLKTSQDSQVESPALQRWPCTVTRGDCNLPTSLGDEPTVEETSTEAHGGSLGSVAFLLCSQPDCPTCQGSFHLSSLVTAPLARAGYPSHGGVSRVTKLLSVLDLYLHGPLSPKARDAQEDQPCPVAPQSPALIRQVRG